MMSSIGLQLLVARTLKWVFGYFLCFFTILLSFFQFSQNPFTEWRMDCFSFFNSSSHSHYVLPWCFKFFCNFCDASVLHSYIFCISYTLYRVYICVVTCVYTCKYINSVAKNEIKNIKNWNKISKCVTMCWFSTITFRKNFLWIRHLLIELLVICIKSKAYY